MSPQPTLPWRWLVPLSFAPGVIAVLQLGRLHPDEVFQVLEPAYHRAFGYGVLAWEWRAGLRNWALPLFFAGWLKACAALGLENPRVYRAVLELPQVALHLCTLIAVYRYSERRVGARWARVGLPLFALYGPVLAFAGRTMSESFSAAWLVLAVDQLDRTERPWRRGLFGGAWLGLSVVTRYGSAVMVLPALLWLAALRRGRVLAGALLGGAVVAAALGALDLFTWGKPFASLLAYLDFNVLSGKAAAQFGAEPWSFYLPRLAAYVPLWAWPGLALAWRTQRPRAALPLVTATVYLAALFVTPHKEARFLYPALVLLALGALPGVMGWLGALRKADLRDALVVLGGFASIATFLLPNELSAQRGDQFRATVAASRGDARGFLLVNEGLWGSPGYFYLGKNIPFLTCDWPRDGSFQQAMRDPRFNRVVTYGGRALAELQAAGFRTVSHDGEATVLSRP